MRLTVIVPAYNEEESLPSTIRSVSNFLSGWWQGDWEIIVVDDGSSDGTAAVCEELGSARVRLVRLGTNRGKGAALTEGAKAAGDGYILLMDADSSTAIDELPKLWAAAEAADLAFGSRAVAGSSISRHQPRYRELAGKAGNLLIRALLLPGVADSQCGFKLLAPAAVPVLRAVRTQGWGFDVELLAMATARGLRIREVPVSWQHDSSSAIGLGSYLSTLAEVLKLAWRIRVRRDIDA